MEFKEIIEKLIARDNQVTTCFFFWDGPTLQRIEEIRRTDPEKAAKKRRPVCVTCRPLLLKILHKVYDGHPFNYNDLVTDFWLFLVTPNGNGKCPLESINDPERLMSWISTTAYYYFLRNKIGADQLLENSPLDPLLSDDDNHFDAEEAEELREFVQRVLAAMPNRHYAQLIDDVVLELYQFSGRERIIKRRELAEEHQFNDMDIHRAKTQFKRIAENIKI